MRWQSCQSDGRGATQRAGSAQTDCTITQSEPPGRRVGRALQAARPLTASDCNPAQQRRLFNARRKTIQSGKCAASAGCECGGLIRSLSGSKKTIEELKQLIANTFSICILHPVKGLGLDKNGRFKLSVAVFLMLMIHFRCSTLTASQLPITPAKI